MKNMITVSESSLTPTVTGTSPRFAQCQRAASAVSSALCASVSPSQPTNTSDANTKLAPIPATAIQPDSGLPRRCPRNASSTNVASGVSTPAMRYVSYELKLFVPDGSTCSLSEALPC
jgi:hypothetical protein